MQLWKSIPALALTVLLGGCGDGSPDAVTYRVPTEEAPPPPSNSGMPRAPFAANAGSDMDNMAAQTLPEGAINTGGHDPRWQAPSHWEEAPASNVRRASYVVRGEGGEADMSVTSFPGDVGGDLANVNRWRRQLNLAPINANQLAQALQPMVVDGEQSKYVEIFEAGEQATIAAIVPHHGNTWFFKLTGPNALVAREREAFKAYVQSTRFH
ncbi:MAG: hypothetical protein Q7P63_16575 [Verrucomicrobiota bacterium JB022]|nr:hypothetical protein [Verrucomicrobiota bacterium JB022]